MCKFFISPGHLTAVQDRIAVAVAVILVNQVTHHRRAKPEERKEQHHQCAKTQKPLTHLRSVAQNNR